MNKLKKGLIGIILPALFSVSGCGDILSKSMRSALIPEEKPVDMSQSLFAEEYKEIADGIMESAREKKDPKSMRKLKIAAIYYSRIKEWDNMMKAAKMYARYDPENGDLLFQECQKEYDFHKPDKK